MVTDEDMVKVKEVDGALKKKIVKAHMRKKVGYKKLSKRFDIPVTNVRGIIKRYKASGTTKSSPRSGRPMKMTAVAWRRGLIMVKNIRGHPPKTRGRLWKRVELMYQTALSRDIFILQVSMADVPGESHY